MKFIQSKAFASLQSKIDARNATLQQARQQLDTNNAFMMSEFDAIKRNLTKLAAKIKA